MEFITGESESVGASSYVLVYLKEWNTRLYIVNLECNAVIFRYERHRSLNTDIKGHQAVEVVGE